MSRVKTAMGWDLLESSTLSEARGTLSSDKARLKLADVLDLAGFAEDAEHLRKPIRVGDVMIPHTVAMAAMLAFSGERV